MNEISSDGTNRILNFTFQIKIRELNEGKWTFKSKKMEEPAPINQAYVADPEVKLAEKVLKLAAEQTEKMLLETFPTRYKAKPPAKTSV